MIRDEPLTWSAEALGYFWGLGRTSPVDRHVFQAYGLTCYLPRRFN